MRSITLVTLAALMATPAIAQERETLGFGRLFTNDFFGDNEDRWRSGSFSFSIVRGSDWTGDLATTATPLLEYRLRSEIIAPAELDGTDNDRAYVGALSAGLHTHFAARGAEVSAGVDLVAVGPQTGLAGAQDWFHNVVGAPAVSTAVVDSQVQNAFYPTAIAEVGYPVQLNPDVTVRPFVEAQIGVEDMLRVGTDIMFMDAGRGDLWLRDSTTGQRYQGINGEGNGIGYVFGVDYAVVGDSAYFPASFGTVAEDDRLRMRAGVHAWYGQGTSLKLDFNF